jgi:peptide-methionine (S)-S-oxide reductase
VVRTRVGYAGGDSVNPSYYNIGDHSETVQIDYDPGVISYENLLAVFWMTHEPVYESYSRQYDSIILYYDEAQKRLALESKQREEARLGKKIYTEIRPFSRFYLAEDYHQKYYLRNVTQLFSEYKIIYPDINDLIGSTAAARVNGYLGGYGKLGDLENQLHGLGLSSSAEKSLLEIGKSRLNNNTGGICPLPN